ARAGATGAALSLVSPEDHPHVRGIETLIGQTIERRLIEGFAGGPPTAAPSRTGATGSRPGSSAPVTAHASAVQGRPGAGPVPHYARFGRASRRPRRGWTSRRPV